MGELQVARWEMLRLSSGIEGALHVVERYLGAGIRHEAADYMEYVPHDWRASG